MRKYTLYAIGEIALVVIGILIALQVNNWNEERKNRKLEIIYLKNLKEDAHWNANHMSQMESYYETIARKIESPLIKVLNSRDDTSS
jgi:hypothetical protein